MGFVHIIVCKISQRKKKNLNNYWTLVNDIHTKVFQLPKKIGMDFSTFDLMPLCVSVVVIILLQGSLYPGVGSPREVFPQGF